MYKSPSLSFSLSFPSDTLTEVDRGVSNKISVLVRSGIHTACVSSVRFIAAVWPALNTSDFTFSHTHTRQIAAIDSRDLSLSDLTCKSCRPICERVRRLNNKKRSERAKIVHTGCKNDPVYVKVRCALSLLIWVYKLSNLSEPLCGIRRRRIVWETVRKGARWEINKAENETIKKW